MLITPTCTCVVDELLTLRACGMEHHIQVTIRLTLKFRTVITTKLYNMDVHMERQISEVTFGIVFKGTFRGNGVATERLKEVAASDEATES